MSWVPGASGSVEDVGAGLVVFGNLVDGEGDGRRHGGAFLRRLTLGGRREVLLHLRFDDRGIEVADGDDGHEIGSVPALVEGVELGDGRVLDDVDQANGTALGIAGVAEQSQVDAIAPAGVEALAEAPLLQHHASLQLDLLRIETDGVGPVAEDLEGRLEDLRITGGDLEEVDGRVVRGIRVQVGPEAAADRLEVFDDLVLGEALGAVEGHVLDEVGEAALLLLLQDGTGLDHE